MAGGLTVEKIRAAQRMLEKYESVEGWSLSPQEYRGMVLMGVSVGFVEHWEAWQLLYNRGFRGRLLNDFNYERFDG